VGREASHAVALARAGEFRHAVTKAAGRHAITAANVATMMNAGHGRAGATVRGISMINAGCIADAIAMAADSVAVRAAGVMAVD
jgi:hypothetical protein